MRGLIFLVAVGCEYTDSPGYWPGTGVEEEEQELPPIDIPPIDTGDPPVEPQPQTWWRIDGGTGPCAASDGAPPSPYNQGFDADNDGLTLPLERDLQTLDKAWDTDNDGDGDFIETFVCGTDPRVPSSRCTTDFLVIPTNLMVTVSVPSHGIGKTIRTRARAGGAFEEAGWGFQLDTCAIYTTETVMTAAQGGPVNVPVALQVDVDPSRWPRSQWITVEIETEWDGRIEQRPIAVLLPAGS